MNQNQRLFIVGAGVLLVAGLALTVLLTAQDASADAAAGGTCGSGVVYEQDGNGFVIFCTGEEGTTGEMSDWKYVQDIPWYGSGHPMIFTLCDGVVSIGGKAFSGMHILSLSIPGSVRSIGDNAFEGSDLGFGLVLEGLSVGDYAFQGARQDSVTICDTVGYVSPTAFRDIRDTVLLVGSPDLGIDLGPRASGNIVIYVDGDTDVTAGPVRVGEGHVRLPCTSFPAASRWTDGVNVYSDGDLVPMPDADNMVLRHVWDGTVSVSFADTGQVEFGNQVITVYSVPVRPADPFMRGYDFAGWSVDGVPYGFDRGFAEDTVITAMWEKARVWLSWVDSDGTVLGMTEAVFGEVPERPADPDKPGYSFAGWVTAGEPYGFDRGFEKDTTFIAIWEVAKIGLSWEDGLGNVLCTAHLYAGEVPERPADPEREGYRFTGWSVDGVPYCHDRGFTGDTVIAAVWAELVELTWVDSDGRILGVTSAVSGEVPERPADPEKPGHAFAGWVTAGRPYMFDRGFSKDATLIATWSAAMIALTWEDGLGNVLCTSYAAAGEVPERPADPERDGYAFVGWSVDGVICSHGRTFGGDTVLTAVWEPAFVEVVWKDSGGNVLRTDAVAYGEVPDYGGPEPRMDGTESSVYVFSGWEPAVCEVYEDTEFTAVFSGSVRICRLLFGPSEGIVYSEGELGVPYGSEVRIAANELFVDGVSVLAVPDSPDSTIKGWSVPDGHTVTADMCITALYESVSSGSSGGPGNVTVLAAVAACIAAIQAAMLVKKRKA